MPAPTHPQDFYIAHRVYTFSRQHQRMTEWGSFTDGPEDRQQVLDRLADWCLTSDEHKPALDTFRVWHFQDDVPARDVTDDMLSDVLAQVESQA